MSTEIIRNDKQTENELRTDENQQSELMQAIVAETRTVTENDNENMINNLTTDKQLTRSSSSNNNKNSSSGGSSNKKQHVSKKNNAKDKLKQNNSNKNNRNNNLSGYTKVAEKLEKAECSLSGLASLKRVGNVKVLSEENGLNTTIKAKFTLGPLTLRVEKAFKRGSVRNVKTATARTNEMIGRIKFSVVNDRATLMSIKVQQPKQVEVESKDNHDRTREYIWRRTPKIAKLVNEKLKLAAEAILAPQLVEVVRL